jgi:hypothetical protein
MSKYKELFISKMRKGMALPTPEQLNVDQQNQRMTNVNSGSAPPAPTTPDSPLVGKRWHEEEEKQNPQQTIKSLNLYKSLLKATSDNINKALDEQKSYLKNEKQFATEVLGKSIDFVNSPFFDLKPIEKVEFSKWLIKSMHNKTTPLKDWIKKN